MQTFIRFVIYGSGSNHDLVIEDKSAYYRILELAAKLDITKALQGKSYGTNTIRCPCSHPGLPKLFEGLQKEGWSPFFGRVVPRHLKGTHFAVRLVNIYNDEDLDNAELLRLMDAWGGMPITGFVRRNGQRWVGIANEEVGCDSGKGWDQTHGTVDGWHNYFIHSKVKSNFDSLGLTLNYHSLEWDKPELAQGEFWEIDTIQVMPPCITKVVTYHDGSRFYDDQGYDLVELKYSRSEVEAMGKFDAAWTREEIGKAGDPRDGGHLLVVSQRFRRACIDLGLEHVGFVPVRLV